MDRIADIIPNINIGFEIPNIKKLVNTVAYIFGIKESVNVMPLRLKALDEDGYAVKQGSMFTIFINKKYLKADKINNFTIRLITHEMWHIKQMIDGRLVFNEQHTKAIWEGVEYTNLTAHEDRPFEWEAREAERKYFKQIKELYNGERGNI